MKKILFFLMLLSATTAFAQDVIVKKDGSTILSKVLEITTTEVKYKKFSNPNGPTYSIAKSEIQAINYENGEKEVFTDNSSTVTPSVQQSQPQNNQWYNQQMLESMNASNQLQKERLLANAKSWNTVGWVWFSVSLIAGLGGGGLMAHNGVDETACGIVGGCGVASALIGGGICFAIANNKEKAADAIASNHLYQKQFRIGNGRLDAGVDMLSDSHISIPAAGIGLTYHF